MTSMFAHHRISRRVDRPFLLNKNTFAHCKGGGKTMTRASSGFLVKAKSIQLRKEDEHFSLYTSLQLLHDERLKILEIVKAKSTGTTFCAWVELCVEKRASLVQVLAYTYFFFLLGDAGCILVQAEWAPVERNTRVIESCFDHLQMQHLSYLYCFISMFSMNTIIYSGITVHMNDKFTKVLRNEGRWRWLDNRNCLQRR